MQEVYGRRISKYASQISDNVVDSIDGTDAFNKMMRDIYTKTGKSALAIESDQAAVELADMDLVDGRIEKAFKFIQDKQRKELKHSNEMEYLQMEAQILDIESSTNHEYRMDKLSNRLPLKQLDEDRKHREERLDHILSYGENSRLDLIPKKEYVKQNAFQRVISFFRGE